MTEPRRHITNPPLDDEEEPHWYCPHGVEVDTSGGACNLCADEDAYDGDWYDAMSWGFISDDE